MSVQADVATLERATRTVFGVVTAHAHGNVDDAAFLLSDYMSEETSLGRSPSSSWALLFSASTTWINLLVSEEARRLNSTPAKRINEWSARHARSLT
jgi:hypothetical protein